MQLSGRTINIAKSTRNTTLSILAAAFSISTMGVPAGIIIATISAYKLYHEVKKVKESLKEGYNYIKGQEAYISKTRSISKKMGLRTLPEIFILQDGMNTGAPETTPYGTSFLNLLLINEGIPPVLKKAEEDFLIAHELNHYKRMDTLPSLTNRLAQIHSQTGLLACVFLGATEIASGQMPIMALKNTAAFIAVYGLAVAFNITDSSSEANYTAEFDCDKMAVETTKDPDSAINALIKMHDPLNDWLARQKKGPISHPPHEERVSRIKSMKL